MTAVSTATEAALARDIYEKLVLGFPTKTITQDVDSNGYPIINFDNLAAGSGGAVIRVVPSDDVAGFDSLGLAQRVYHPHVVQACLEESSTSDVFVMISTTFAQVEQVLEQSGCKLEVFKSANGVGPAVGSMTGTPLITLWPDLYNKMKQHQ